LTSTSTWKKSYKIKDVCIICKKEFEWEAIPETELGAKKWSQGWDKPKRAFCSDECKQIYRNQIYQKRLLVLPKKFRSIECDNKNMVMQGINQSIFITGKAGTGKTVLMSGIAKELLKKNDNKILWISYPEFIMELQNKFKKDDTYYGSPYDFAEEVATFEGTLCIDDMGAEKMTAFVQQITYYIINHREQDMLHTIITSNYSLQQIDEQIDERVSSRIGGMCKIIKMTGKDRRLIKGGQ